MEFVLLDETLNDRGSRVLMDGMDLKQFKRNPGDVLHAQSKFMGPKGNEVIGRWKNVRKEKGRLIASAIFDKDETYAARIAKKVEDGFIRMASVGIYVIETSGDKKYLIPGQTRPTITKCELIEVSIVDIGGNKNALRLYDKNNQVLALSAALPALKEINFEKNNTMNEKQLALLGLDSSAKPDEITNALSALKAKADAAPKQTDKSAKEVEALVSKAVADKKIKADQSAVYIKLATTDYVATEAALNAMASIPQLSKELKPGSKYHEGRENWTLDDWLEKDPNGFKKLTVEDNEKFMALNKAYFGE